MIALEESVPLFQDVLFVFKVPIAWQLNVLKPVNNGECPIIALYSVSCLTKMNARADIMCAW